MPTAATTIATEDFMMLVTALIALITTPALAGEDFPWSKDSPEAKVYSSLLPREMQTSCATLTEDLESPAKTLNRIVETVTMPPWVPMRAATCMLDEHLDEAIPFVQDWLRNTETAGLAKLVQRRIDRMPTLAAEPIQKTALEGPHRKLFETDTK